MVYYIHSGGGSLTGWMDMALEEARAAYSEGEVPVGAVLVKNDKLLARNHNRREQLSDPTAHAEILVIKEGALKLNNWHLKGCTLFVTLEPCPMCAGAMLMAGLSECVYGAYDAHYGCCGSVYDIPSDPALGGKTLWKVDKNYPECEIILQKFFSSLR